jgi:hypothetical protein
METYTCFLQDCCFTKATSLIWSHVLTGMQARFLSASCNVHLYIFCLLFRHCDFTCMLDMRFVMWVSSSHRVCTLFVVKVCGGVNLCREPSSASRCGEEHGRASLWNAHTVHTHTLADVQLFHACFAGLLHECGLC